MANGKELKEPLIVRSMGYLKVPQAVKELLPNNNPRNLPNPTCEAKETKDEIVITYTFKKKDIKK